MKDKVASCQFWFLVPVRMTLSEIGQGAFESYRGVGKHRDHPSLWREHPGNGKLPILVEGAPRDANLWVDLDARASSFGLGREGGAKWLQRSLPLVSLTNKAYHLETGPYHKRP